MMKCLVGLSLLLASQVALSQNEPAYSARYKVEFIADWSADTHPAGFPGNPHFSGLIGATHPVDTQLWESGGLATPGIRLMAETGSKSILNNEINVLINNQQAESLVSGGGIGTSPGSVSLEFDVSQNSPLISLVSMIAPSPDWFVGVDSLSLRSDGQWQEQLVVELHAYDAGTDSGSSYTSSNRVTNPQQPISMITESPFNANPVLGRFVFELIGTQGNFPLSGNQSGLYFTPENSGDGVTLIVSESEGRNFALVTWYTYRNGQQMWLVGSTDFEAGESVAQIEMFRTTGASFGVDFNADDVMLIPWGDLTLTIPSCGHMNVDFTGTEDSSEFGTIEYTQLANVGVFDCE